MPSPKITASLVPLVEPFLESAETLREVETLVGMGVLGWNLANTPEKERADLIRETMDESPEAEAEGFLEMLGLLSERKKALFPDDRRLVLSWEVRQDRDEFRIIAASAEPEDA